VPHKVSGSRRVPDTGIRTKPATLGVWLPKGA
jgi:hypothetical protein